VPGLHSRLVRPRLALFALVFGCYAYFYQAGGWNQNSRFDLTRAMVEKHSLRIDAYERNTGDDAKRDGHFYCDKAPLVSWLGVPTHALLWSAAGAPAQLSPHLLMWSSYVATLVAVALPSAIATVFLFDLALLLGLSAAWAAAGALAYALGTLAFPYSTLLYGHQLVASLHVIALALLVGIRRGAPATPARLVAVGALLGAAVAAEYPAALGGAVLGLYALHVVRPRARALGWIVAGGVLPIVLLCAYHAAAFGGPFTLPYAFSTQRHRHMGWFMGLGVPDLHVLGQLLWSVRRGLFYSAPWLLLALPGLVLWARRSGTRAEAIVCAAIILLHLWLNSSLVDWDGGWCVGPRYLVSCLPFVAVSAFALAREASAGAWVRAARVAFAALAGALVALSIYMMLAATAVKPEAPSSLRVPFANYILPAFTRGDLAISTQSIDRPDAPVAAPPQAWNLGQRLGLDGKTSLLPLALWVAATGAWLVFALRQRRAGTADVAGDAVSRVAS
jgi:hypothetical protein